MDSECNPEQPADAPQGSVLLVFDQVNAYQTTLLAGIRSVLTSGGIPYILYAHDLPSRELRWPVKRLLNSGHVVGVITTILSDPASHADMLAAVAACGKPSVHIGSPQAGTTSVGVDNAPGMRELMAHLLDEAGARTVALARGPGHHPDARHREALVRDELTLRGLHLSPSLIIEGRFDRDSSYAGMTQLLRRQVQFDAVVALNDRSAAGVIDALLDAGLRVPEDVLVTGFDDDDVALPGSLGLTTVTQRLFEQGVHAVELLMGRLAGTPASGHHTTPSQLVVRSSTGHDVVGQHRSGPPDTEDRPTVAAMERALAINRAFGACNDIAQLLTVVADNTARLSLARCFIVLNETCMGRSAKGSVVLRHLSGHTLVPRTPATFDLDDVLPAPSVAALHTGAWTLQPLAAGTVELGYALFEQIVPDRFIGELIRMDLAQAIDRLQRITRHAEALAEQTSQLESLVVQRTAELRAEVISRAAAEAELTLVNAELRKLSRVDGLTGVANRSGFDEYLAEQWDLHAHSGQPLSLLIVDVDHFKQHNDTYGHPSGDLVLRQVGQRLRAALWSPRDMAARYGGDEFVALLPDTDEQGAVAVAERIQRAVRAMTPAHKDSLPATVSIGVASVHPCIDGSCSALIAEADTSLYRAKSSGRNCTDTAGGGGRPDSGSDSTTRATRTF